MFPINHYKWISLENFDPIFIDYEIYDTCPHPIRNKKTLEKIPVCEVLHEGYVYQLYSRNIIEKLFVQPQTSLYQQCSWKNSCEWSHTYKDQYPIKIWSYEDVYEDPEVVRQFHEGTTYEFIKKISKQFNEQVFQKYGIKINGETPITKEDIKNFTKLYP
jgi:hypothetical protein